MDKDNLIQKWLLDELSEEESKKFDALEDASFYKNIISDASSFKASNFSTVDDFETFKKRNMVPDTKVRKLEWIKPMLRIASIVVIAIGVYFFFLSNQLTEVQTLVAEKTTIELPDASKVVINALSEVSYDKGKWDNKREIRLKGEAFFDVAKGAKFDVITPEGTVSVLGTEFNVKQRNGFFEVACFEGTVRVVSDGHTEILQVGDNFKIVNGIKTSGKNSYNEPQWTNNTSYFQRVPVSEVLDELQRQYAIKITVDNVDTDQLFTGGFVHGDLDNALKAISEPMSLDFEILKGTEVRFSKGD
ncbi:FecR family protein [Maribacter aestuarii]|uniref:FecR family protein n=1 Tax=Maribacter aestuarii TaxID=1130723 RepID=UPI00248C733B|nr:FecR domain-containing protein [Maribacter aestuarii]